MTRFPVLAAWSTALALAPLCAAGVTYSNLGPGATHDIQYRFSTSVGIFPDYRAELAWRFQAEESGRLDLAKLALYRETTPSQVFLSLYEDTGSEPGALLKTWSVSLPLPSQPQGHAWELPLPDGPWMQAGSSYYLATRLATPASGWQWFSAPRVNSHFPLTRLAQRPGSGGPWEAFDDGGLAAFELHVDPCGSADFNGDADFGTDADIEAFFNCLSGDCCAACFPGGADFNGDGDTGTDADIEAFFRVLSGGTC